MTQSTVTPGERIPGIVAWTFLVQMVAGPALAASALLVNTVNPQWMVDVRHELSYGVNIARYVIPWVAYANKIQNPTINLNSTLLELEYSGLYFFNLLASIIYIYRFPRLVQMYRRIRERRLSTDILTRASIFVVSICIYSLYGVPFNVRFAGSGSNKVEMRDYAISSIAPALLLFFGVLALANAYAYLFPRRVSP